MNKVAIRDFAVKARYKLINEIVTKANMIGISEEGVKSPLPQSNADIQYFDIGGDKPYELKRGDISKRNSLIDAINLRVKSGQSQKDAFQDTVEEIAYTWFNRIIAIRFMEVNDYLPSGIRVLSSEDSSKKEPDLVTKYYDSDLSLLNEDIAYIEDLKRKNKPDDLFKFLFIKQCNKLGEILPFLFEKTHDYCELMLSISYTDDQGIVRQLINSVAEDDFKEAVEIIGWMYQYYIAQKKEEVFKGLKNNTKITKSTLPSATQIFTPDWIVKYMADNTLGKMWIESHPNSRLKQECEYYLEPVEQEISVKKRIDEINAYYKNKKLEEIKFIDPCCGSGHILVYAFDMFYKMYEEQGYIASEIPDIIVANNLYGVDVDKRATQLTSFAISMKARSYNKRYFKKSRSLPNVIDVKESNAFKFDNGYSLCKEYFSKNFSHKENDMFEEIIFKFEDAELYGSLIKDFKYQSYEYREFARQLTEIASGLNYDIDGYIISQSLINTVIPLLEQAGILAMKYDIVVTNPPYAGNSKLPSNVQDYLKVSYPNAKSDLFSAFIERNMDYGTPNAHLGIMCPNSWMFLGSFEELRKKIIKQKTLTSLIQLANSGFTEAVVFVSTFTFRNCIVESEKGEYIRLVDFGGVEAQPLKTKEAIKNRDCGYRYSISSSNFADIPGNTIAYWASENIIKSFSDGTCIDKLSDTKQGMIPGNSDVFIKFWYEVNIEKIGFGLKSSEEIITSKKRWFPYNKGGAFRKWYGNIEHIIDMENDGYRIKYSGLNNNYRLRDPELYFKEALTWSKISSGDFSARYMPVGNLFDIAGCCIFNLKNHINYVHGLLNSIVAKYMFSFISPTLNYEVDHIKKIPIIFDSNKEQEINKLVVENIEISRRDWDRKERSWNFNNDIFKGKGLIKDKLKEVNDFIQQEIETLKRNEERINEIFINIYNVSNDLNSNVMVEDLSIEKYTEKQYIKELMSFVVGCIFGRYDIDNDDIAYAGGVFDNDNYRLSPDKDNIIPITDDEYFDDDIVSKVIEVIKTIYGESDLNANINFIAKVLGGIGTNPRETIRNYILKDFYNDHCQMFANRPIYWLFDSGKENGFKALVYLHRYEEDTIAKMRAEYLHKVQRVYESEMNRMQETIENSTDNREVAVARKKKEKFTKQLLETKEYDEVLGHVALQRIPLDLDDGVKVNYQKFQNIDYIKNGKSVKKNLLVNIFK